jgi:hypothetical protein
MQMEVRAAHAGNEYPEQDLSRAWLGDRKLAHLVPSGLVVNHGLHRVHGTTSYPQAKE